MTKIMQSGAAAQAATITSAPRLGGVHVIIEGSEDDHDQKVRAARPIGLFLPGKSDAAAEAALVVSGFRSGVRAVIDACVRTFETVQRFGDDPVSIDAFLAGLVDGNLISRSEARLGKASPKLVKLCTIGANCGLLSREEVFEHLVPGYSVIYQALVLYNTLQGSEDDRFNQLVRILREERPVSREALIARTAAAKAANKGLESVPAAVDRHVGPVADIRHTHDFVLLTPDRTRHFSRLNEDYLDRPGFSQLAHDLLAQEATAVVVARLADLPLIENKLLPMCGFEGMSRVFLIREPLDADVTHAEIAVLAKRGPRDDAIKEEFEWFPRGEALDAALLWSRLAPNATRKLHLFASEKRNGWTSIIGEANWNQTDE